MVKVTVVNLVANTPTTVTLTRTLKVLDLQARTAVDVQFSINDSNVWTNSTYITVKSGTYFRIELPPDLIALRPTLYLRAASNVTVEVIEWFADVNT